MGYAEMRKNGALGPIPVKQRNAVEIITRRSKMLRGLVENIAMLWQMENAREESPILERLDLGENERDRQQHSPNQKQHPSPHIEINRCCHWRCA